MHPRNRRRAKPFNALSSRLESLEERAMLSITPGPVDGGLTDVPVVISPQLFHFAGRPSAEVATPAWALDMAAIQARVDLLAQQLAGNEHYRITADGNIIAVAENHGLENAPAAEISYASFPLDQTFELESLPGASKTIYLDFDGHTTVGTPWNNDFNMATITSTPYSLDTNDAFSDAELAEIQRIWERVAEDFLPFQVNVTTREPETAALINSGGDDTTWGTRVVVSETTNLPIAAGGVAYISSFAWNTDTPAFVWNIGEIGAAEAITHEVGHALGLHHSGKLAPNPVEYYAGHGSGATGWAPIMGVGYYKELVQWSKGEYPGANNQDDALQIITSQNGFGYRTDDHGNSSATATQLNIVDSSATADGIIERTADLDFFSFSNPYTSIVSLDVVPFYLSPNLDILVSLYGPAGLVASNNPVNKLNASLNATLPAGTYYVSVDGTGKAASGEDAGYSDYGSIGFYSLNFTTTAAPPFAVDDNVTILEGTISTSINVLGNDLVGSEGSPLDPTSVTIVAAPTAGTASVDTLTGQVLYSPSASFVGTDTFTYRMSDMVGVLSNTALVTVRVNRPPVAVDDSVKTTTNTPIDINVLENDTDAETGGGLDVTTVAIVSQPINGSVSVNSATGVVTYTPNTGFAGNDLFTYTVMDNDGAVSNVAEVSIFVNAPPVANNDSASTLPGVPVTIAVLSNDFDPTPGGGLVPSSVTVVAAATGGTALVNVTTGTITYTPNAAFSGSDSFQYTVTDVDGGVSNIATVAVLVNSPPIAIDDAVNTPVNTPVTVSVVANDLDPDTAGGINVATVQIVQPPKNGTATRDDLGNITYTPNAGFQGGDIVKYTVRDDRGAVSNVATVIFRVGNLHTVAGQVYVDLNGDQVRNGSDWPIAGVTVWLTSNDPDFPFIDLAETDANGRYEFTNVVTGNFTIREQHPGFFNDGPEVNNSGLTAALGGDAFGNVAFAGGDTFTGFDFTETGLRAEFVAAYANRHTFFSSGGGASLDSLNLGKGEVWVAVDGGILGDYQATALASSGGSVTLALYDNNLQLVKRSTTGTLAYSASSSSPFFLKVSGTAAQVSINSYVISPAAPPQPQPQPQVQWSNPVNAMDVDGNGAVEPRDLLLVIDALNRYGAGSLIARSVPSSHYLDVNNQNDLTPQDALLIIDQLNRQAAQFAVAADTEFSDAAADIASQTPSAALAQSSERDLAFALALNGALEEEGNMLLNSRRR